MKKLCMCLLVLILLVQMAPVTAAFPKEVTTPIAADVAVHEQPQLYSAEPQTDDLPECHTVEEMAVILRNGMKQRQNTIQMMLVTENYYEEMLTEAATMALQHTGRSDEGDYLSWQHGKRSCGVNGYLRNGVYHLTITYQITYYTTLAQEKQVTARIADLISQWNVDEMSDYDKIRTAYNWICNNVVYDEKHLNDENYLLKFTAYAALEHGTSVCQGYTLLLYRLLLEMGIDNRIVFGVSEDQGHAWNIVKLNDKYYNLDATWDAARHQNELGYQFFLCCQEHFENHERDASMDTPEFHAKYPMAPEDYGIAGHQYKETVVPPTCTEKGYTIFECKICGYTYTGARVMANGHSWNEGTIKKEPTENETGLKVQECTVCKESREVVLPKKNHVHKFTAKKTQATCLEMGYTTYSCACGVSYQDDYVDITDHDYEVERIVQPTCTMPGQIIYCCSYCNDVYQQENGEPLDHSYESEVIAPTCTAKGYTIHTCIRCQHSFTDHYTDKAGHKWDKGVVTKEPTEYTKGIKVQTCTVCKIKTETEIPTLSHTHSYTAVITAPTCTQQGYTTHSCICGDSYVDTPVAPVEHSFGAWTEVTPSTCAVQGQEKRECVYCGTTEKRALPLAGHSFVAGSCTVCGQEDSAYNPSEPDFTTPRPTAPNPSEPNPSQPEHTDPTETDPGVKPTTPSQGPDVSAAIRMAEVAVLAAVAVVVIIAIAVIIILIKAKRRKKR